MSDCPGLLDLLHPDGLAGRVGVVGEGCPDRLRPDAREAAPPWDLAIVAPSASEARSGGWTERAATHTERSMAAEGLVYVLAPPRARARLALALARRGFPAEGTFLHLPSPAASELLLPLERQAFEGAVHRLLAPGSSRSRALLVAAGVPGALRMLARLHPSVGLLARRPSSRPLASWISATEPRRRLAMIRVRWRLDRARAVIHLLPESRAEGAVVKVALREPDPAGGLEREAAALAELAPAARAAGAAVPAGTLSSPASRCPALLLDRLAGTPAFTLLAARPTAYEGVVRGLGAWLEAWSRATCRARHLDAATLDAWVLGPARRLADRFEGGAEYSAWLESRCKPLVGRAVPVVATHNDLTMSNVLVQPGGKLGIVDWEAAAAEGLPLRDFAYAAVDATAARDRYRDRPGAFDRCFGAGGSGVVGEVLRRLRRAVDLPEDFATVAFHACWLQHAEDEQRKRGPGERLPFLECVRRAAVLRGRI
ncbi:MAG TPA: hypothetical protein VFZ26_10925 [Gemmatimonadales bacterium]